MFRAILESFGKEKYYRSEKIEHKKNENQKKKKKKSKGLSSLPGGGQVDGLPPAASSCSGLVTRRAPWGFAFARRVMTQEAFCHARPKEWLVEHHEALPLLEE